MSEAIINIRNLSVSYGARFALSGVNLTIAARDFAVFVGPNGGGKTTLFRALLGITEVASGDIELCGATPAQGREHVGYVSQRNDYDARFPLRVREVVAMGCLGPGMRSRFTRTDERERIAAALATVEMSEHADRPIRALSGGQLQRIFIARALVCRPRVLILDEPVTHLDPAVTGKFYELLRRLNGELTIFMSTHDLNAAHTCGNRIFEVNAQVRELPIAEGGRHV